MVWVVVLLALGGLCLIISEVFVPGGVLGMLGGAALIGCVVLAVMNFSTAGIIATVFLVPAAGITAWIVAFRVLSRSRLGSSVFLRTTQKGMSVLSGSAEQLTHLIGKRGVALSYLRPAGVAEIDGERVDVVTEGEYVPAGTPIEVIELEGNHLVVRAVPDEGKQAPTT
jgi:membrane-bound serine protease (ClpP class)